MLSRLLASTRVAACPMAGCGVAASVGDEAERQKQGRGFRAVSETAGERHGRLETVALVERHRVRLGVNDDSDAAHGIRRSFCEQQGLFEQFATDSTPLRV